MSPEAVAHLLLMEDDPGIARLVRRRLEREGYVVDHAADGEQGLAMCRARAYDAIMLDHEMPVYNGLDVLRKLAESDVNLPAAIMVTGAGSEEVAVQAMRLGARDYVVKDAACGYLDLLPAVVQRAIRQHRMEAQLRLAGRVFESLAEAVVVMNADRQIVSVNHGFTTITGYSPEDVFDAPFQLLDAEPHRADFCAAVWAIVNDAGQWEGEVRHRRKDGSVFPASVAIGRVEDERGRLTDYVAVFSDITLRKEAETRLRHAATHDPLTDLPNRSLLFESLSRDLALARRGRRRLGVMLLDLDGFKAVNDTMGHEAGDLLLQEVARRLVGRLRESDVVARLGGDEFAIILPEAGEGSLNAAVVADKILSELQKPLVLCDAPYGIKASIGISLYPADGDDPEVLLRCADLAMYRAKKTRTGFQFYSSRL